MNDKINVEAILSKRIIRFPVDDIMPDEMQIRKNVKAAIKEIVEAVIDKCADVKLGFKSQTLRKQTILNIKKEIEYE